MTLRYTLVDQQHFLGEHDGKPVVVTAQRWDARRAAARRSQHVILHDGVVVLDKLVVSARDLSMMDGMFAQTAKVYAGLMLTEDAARDLIGERTGTRPADEYCYRRTCSTGIPLGAKRCGDGHAGGQVGAGSISGVMRNPMILRTGGAR